MRSDSPRPRVWPPPPRGHPRMAKGGEDVWDGRDAMGDGVGTKNSKWCGCGTQDKDETKTENKNPISLSKSRKKLGPWSSSL